MINLNLNKLASGSFSSQHRAAIQDEKKILGNSFKAFSTPPEI